MDEGGEQTRVSDCRACGSSLAHDQRYCLRCGARRRALPAYIAQAIARIRERGGTLGDRAGFLGASAAHDAAGASDDHPAEHHAGAFDAWLRAPRAAAVAVLGMLGFGVIVGSLVGESAASGPQQIIVEVPTHTSPQPAPPGAAATGALSGAAAASGGGGGGGGTQTITVGSGGTQTITTPAPSSSGGAQTNPSSAPTTPAAGLPTGGSLPPIKHVFMITLSGQGYNQTFAHSANDPYLAKTLAAKGEVVPNYYSVAGGSLANEIALVSGQGPTPDTVANCPSFTNVVPGNRGARGQILGNGCVYPKDTQTLAGQLATAKLKWKAYVQVTGTRKAGRLESCKHPKLGAADTQPTGQDPSATWHNPFLYFHSLIDKARCPTNDVPLTELSVDLRTAKTTPTLSYVIPDACDDGSDSPCLPGGPSGMLAADDFLKSVVPEIETSPAYKANGLIVITFDQAPQTGPNADQSSCCNNPTYPNLPPPPSAGTITTSPGSTTPATTSTATTTPTSTSPTTTPPPTTSTPTTTATIGTSPTTPATTPTTGTSPTTPTTTTPASLLGSGQSNPTGGGGQVGLLLISRYVKPGIPDVIDYFNHFSLLASIESIFGLKRLGYASDPALPVFGSSVFDNYSAG